ncbi:enoyl-CoA hydratase/isomerase family protein [Streptomyces sp.]|uniref:enoyl-CoA hydratase/isomerase family protein n=1 Tax=Streptomyces sp. TaxID=1931 RepID=UPI002F42EA8D
MTAGEFTRIRVDWHDGVTSVVLDRPHRRNAIDLELARELLEAALMERTAASRCVVLSGEGGHFCVGGDLKSFRDEPDLPGHLLAVTTYLHAAMTRLATLPAPLVVAARGHVAGAGLGLACLADVLLVEEGSTFRSAYAALGLSPDAATSYLLPRLVGLRRARRMTHLGYVLEAKEAVEWGLCTEWVPAGGLAERARAVAAQLAAGPTRAFGQTARLLDAAWRRTLVEHLDDEATTLSTTAATADAREGIAAFVERRAAEFGGRE